MKFRTDFVTNSSSSSFIISKDSDIQTADSLFNLMKKLYFEYKSNCEKMIEFCKKDKRFIYIEDKNVVRINDTDLDYKERMSYNDELFEKFGLNYWTDLSYEPSWINFETYEDYINSSNEKYISYHNMPFIIIDIKKNDVTEIEKSIIKDIAYWYFPCFENDHFTEISCKHCKRRKDELCDIVNNGTPLTEKEIFNRINSICLYSESGYIHEYIVSKLCEISKLCCNHMG